MYSPIYIMTTAMAVMAFLTICGFIFSDYSANRQRSKSLQDQKELLDYEDTISDENVEDSRQWTEQFWKENQSPNAIFDQYKNLGASDSAALMSAMGVSPSVASSPTAQLGSGSLPYSSNTFAEMLNSFQNSLNSFYSNENTKADTENKVIQNEYLPRINEASIKSTLSMLDLNWQKFGLDKRNFEEIAKPLARSTMWKNSVEIDQMRQNIMNLHQQYLNDVQRYYQIKAQTRNIDADTNLKNAQTITEGFKQNLLSSETNKTNAEAAVAWFESRLKAIDVELSELCGVNLTLNWQNVGFESLERTAQDVNNVFKSCTKTLDAIESSLDFHGKTKRAWKLTQDFFDKHYGSYDQYLKHRGENFKKPSDWIRRNTMYGID